jgi:dimethylaniline monooxygenase (N-oxide forming)
LHEKATPFRLQKCYCEALLTVSVFFNKSPKVAPYINNPWKPKRPQTLLQQIRSVIIQTPTCNTGGRHVDLAPWPKLIGKDRLVTFRDNGRPEYLRIKDETIQPDVVVFCTGYTRQFPFLAGTGFEPNVRDIWNSNDPSVGFIGFVRPSLGAIPPLAELQAQLWVLNLVAPDRIGKLDPDDEPHYRLVTSKEARIRYGIDHESYAYQLALDMGSAPSFCEVLRLGRLGPRYQIWRLPMVWALGANFNAKFRLRGPWKWDGATNVLTQELWETVTRRPIFFGNSFLFDSTWVQTNIVSRPFYSFCRSDANIWTHELDYLRTRNSGRVDSEFGSPRLTLTPDYEAINVNCIVFNCFTEATKG